jgi:hypothetical protein
MLKCTGLYRGPIDKQIQYYALSAEDSKGNVFSVSFGCKINYSESVEKAFSRIQFIDSLRESKDDIKNN